MEKYEREKNGIILFIDEIILLCSIYLTISRIILVGYFTDIK